MTNASETILRGSRWVLSYWYLPAFAVATTVAWLVRLRPDNPYQAVRDELRAVEFCERIKRIRADRGVDFANALITNEFFDTIKRLDPAQARFANALRPDPARRVRYLRRMSKHAGQRRKVDGPVE